jgi:hypothetical protein
MYTILVRLIMLLAAFLELGLSLTDVEDCHSRGCLRKIEPASRKVLPIPWKPISIFPEEAKRFR